MLSKNDNFKLFFQEYVEPVYQFAQKYTNDKAIARDITQDAFIKLYERRTDFDVREKAKSFVYTTVRNLCIDHIKHNKVEQRYANENVQEEEHTFLHEITYQETLNILHCAIDKLPRQTREIILLNLKGKNNNEIAEALAISVNTVKTLKKNAYKSLRESLGDDFALMLLALLMLLMRPD